uniref:Evasin n=1 Tax=Amblyomma triste TaxID=251400 RepID=A0A023G5Y9_AMBTT
MSSVFWLTCLLFFIGLTACQEAREDSLDSTPLNATQTDGISPEIATFSNETDSFGNNTNEGPRPEAPGLTNATDLGTNMSTIGEPDSAETITKGNNTDEGEETTSPGIPTEETGSSNDVTVTMNSSAPASNESTNASETAGPSSAAAVTTSSSTSLTNQSTTAVPASEKPPKPTKRPKRPRREQDHYGTLIDKYGCKHNTLESHGKLFTATCKGKCGKRTFPIHNGIPCLHSLPRSGNSKKRGKRQCLAGMCYLGSCRPLYRTQVKCRAPRGTVHYYDDVNYYNYNDDSSYNYRYGNDYGYHFRYANSDGGHNIHAE